MPLIVERREKATVLRGSESGFVPLVRCGHCGEHIGHARDGEAQWSRGPEPGEHLVFLHGSCVDDYRRLHRERYGSIGLGEFLRGLGAKLGVDLKPPKEGSS